MFEMTTKIDPRNAYAYYIMVNLSTYRFNDYISFKMQLR